MALLAEGSFNRFISKVEVGSVVFVLSCCHSGPLSDSGGLSHVWADWNCLGGRTSFIVFHLEKGTTFYIISFYLH